MQSIHTLSAIYIVCNYIINQQEFQEYAVLTWVYVQPLLMISHSVILVSLLYNIVNFDSNSNVYFFLTV